MVTENGEMVKDNLWKNHGKAFCKVCEISSFARRSLTPTVRLLDTLGASNRYISFFLLPYCTEIEKYKILNRPH